MDGWREKRGKEGRMKYGVERGKRWRSKAREVEGWMRWKREDRRLERASQ